MALKERPPIVPSGSSSATGCHHGFLVVCMEKLGLFYCPAVGHVTHLCDLFTLNKCVGLQQQQQQFIQPLLRLYYSLLSASTSRVHMWLHPQKPASVPWWLAPLHHYTSGTDPSFVQNVLLTLFKTQIKTISPINPSQTSSVSLWTPDVVLNNC